MQLPKLEVEIMYKRQSISSKALASGGGGTKGLGQSLIANES